MVWWLTYSRGWPSRTLPMLIWSKRWRTPARKPTWRSSTHRSEWCNKQTASKIALGGSEQKKKGGRNADSLRTARSASACSVQLYKWRSNFPRIWPHLRVLVASAWRKLIDGHSQVANPVFFSLGVCENNSSLFFSYSLAKFCRLKFTFTEQEKWQRRRWPRAPLTDDFHHSRENTPSCMADEEALVLARIIMDHLVIWSAFT